MKDFIWSQQTAKELKALFSGQYVVAIIDTGSLGVVISESCLRRLGLIQDGEIKFTIKNEAAIKELQNYLKRDLDENENKQ